MNHILSTVRSRRVAGGLAGFLSICVLGFVSIRDSAAQKTSSSTPEKKTDQKDSGKQSATKTTQPETGEQPKQKLGELKKISSHVFMSSAGLKYGPGSVDKHRLTHVLKHGKDDPKRPGKHGVFHGDHTKILALLDEVYLAGKKGGRGVKVEKQGDRTVYTVNTGRKIGYVGGQVGNRQGKPEVRSVRLVCEGANVITAFPLSP